MQISEHFASEEFECKCGCGSCGVDSELISMLEKLYKAMNAKFIFISSGVRCPDHSANVGGTRNDAHTRGIATDICVMKQDGEYYSGETIAREAEKIGFTGIGIINDKFAHVDIRNNDNYYNNHWFGDERTGNDYITTFANMGEPIQTAVPPVNKVKLIQTALNDHGYNCGIVDGICGNNTISAMYKLINDLWG